jgi:sulfur-oxidizing protein SoxY
MTRRRELLHHSARVAALLASAGWWPTPAAAQAASAWNRAAFEADTLAEVYKALGSVRPTASDAVRLQAPDIAENGSQVQMNLGCQLPGVKRMALLIEKNPNVLIASFEPSDAVEAQFGLRVKMAQSSNVYAVAWMADGRVLFAVKDVRVTLTGCGNA